MIRHGLPGRLSSVASKRGFTLVEAMVAVALVAIGIVGVLGGLSNIARS